MKNVSFIIKESILVHVCLGFGFLNIVNYSSPNRVDSLVMHKTRVGTLTAHGSITLGYNF